MAAGHPGPRHCIVWSRGLRVRGRRVCESLGGGGGGLRGEDSGGRGLELSIGILIHGSVCYNYNLL